MGKTTALFDCHNQQGAKIVDFGGWDMPLNYGSQIEEHHHVRQDAGMFDVSHMTIVEVKGLDAKSYLSYLLANDINKLKTSGKALYTAMLNEKGGVIDDLWISEKAKDFDVAIEEKKDLAMIAIQGPNAIEKANAILSPAQQQAVIDLKVFSAIDSEEYFIARTGYTGEDGYEIILPESEAVNFWNRLSDAGVKPCGLGARDTLRLEAGMNLYGNDMDETVSPLEANMGWTIAWEPESREFIGKQALLAQKDAGVDTKLVGLVLQDKGVIRPNMKVIVEGVGEGKVTSGTMSPTLKKSIGLARVPKTTGEQVMLDVRGKMLTAKVVRPCFVRKGEALV